MIQKINPKTLFNTETAGLVVLNKLLEEYNINKFIDSKCQKKSGFKISKILNFGIYKNILGITSFVETAEKLPKIPEIGFCCDRTTLGRNFKRLGKVNIHNDILIKISKYILSKYNVKANEIVISIDASTIEVYKDSKTYENATWVWDNAQGKLVFGYYITVINLSFRNLFFPIWYELKESSKEVIFNELLNIIKITKSKKVTFDGGYASDDFFEKLSNYNFEFIGKVPKSWIFNNGFNENVNSIKKKINLKRIKFKKIKAYRVKNKFISKHIYALNFRKNDSRNLISNNLEIKPKQVFKDFKLRWDVETCFKELKKNFCFENLTIRTIDGIVGYLISSFIALILMNDFKLKFKSKLKKLFNKGFKIIIRTLIKVKAMWKQIQNKSCLIFENGFRYKWVFRDYLKP